MGWLRGTKMATDETAKRSNCNHESNRCHALTTASKLMKRILNRVKWFFKVMQGMSSDRPRAVRYTENIRKRQAWKHLFTRSSVPSYQDWNIAENENLQQLLAEMNSNDSQTKTARENMRRQWAGYGEPKWQRMRRQSAATAITNQTEATRSQQHQH